MGRPCDSHRWWQACYWSRSVGTEDDWVRNGISCNDIAVCCVINILFDESKLDIFKRHWVDHCEQVFNVSEVNDE